MLVWLLLAVQVLLLSTIRHLLRAIPPARLARSSRRCCAFRRAISPRLMPGRVCFGLRLHQCNGFSAPSGGAEARAAGGTGALVAHAVCAMGAGGAALDDSLGCSLGGSCGTCLRRRRTHGRR